MTGVDSTIIYIAFKMVLQLLGFLINLILSPFYVTLSAFIPPISDIINSIDGVFIYLTNAINFIMGWIHLPPTAVTLIYTYLLFIFIWYPFSLSFKIVLRMYKVFKG